jgi:aldo/keto reductase family protein
MERASELGFTRSIGLSNFGVRALDQVLAVAKIPPVIDQVQFSPLEYRRSVLRAAQARGIVVEAYSTLGTGCHLADTAAQRTAANVGRTPAQVLVRWCLQRGLVVLAKSTHRDRIKENAAIFRLHPFAVEHGRTRCTRPHPAVRRGARTLVVVSEHRPSSVRRLILMTVAPQQQHFGVSWGLRDADDAGDHDQPYRFGLRPCVDTPYLFNTREYARLLVLKSRVRDPSARMPV